MPHVLLHETAVAMFRRRMRTQKPVVAPWKETLGRARWEGGGLDEFRVQLGQLVQEVP